MDVGLYFFPTDQGPDITAVARAAEEFGLESLFVPEHSHIPATATAFLDPDGNELPERYRRIFDPFVALSAAATVTTRLRIGTAACIVTQRDIVLTAKAVATLDHLSSGRLVFGVGAGWNAEELRTHGVDPAQRIGLFNEAVAAMSRIWSEKEPEFQGEHIQFGPIWSWPKPLQQPRPPVLIAGNSAGAINRVLKFGDGWLPTHRGNHDLLQRVHDLRSRADALERSRPTVTFIAAVADAGTLETCRRAGVDRVLFPILPGSLSSVLTDIERCVHVRDTVLG